MAGAAHRTDDRTEGRTDDTARPADRLADWIDVLHHRYPPGRAEGWDAVGLHVGDLGRDTVRGVMVSLDVTEAVLRETAEAGADLLIAHHPLLFRPLDRLTADTAAGRLALLAARMGIAVAGAHTNVDKDEAGTSHPAATVLGLTDLRPLRPHPPEPKVKLVTFVPTDHTATVREALAAAGAGRIGDYEACSFRLTGTGSFRAGEGTDPYIGTAGEVTEVTEDRLEVLLPATAQGEVMTALRNAHPYEEVAYDLYPLIDDRPGSLGLGLLGQLPAPTPLRSVAAALAEGLDNPHVRIAADDDRTPVTTVAIVGGSGGSLADTARRAGAEVLVTGDVSHHVALDAMTMDLAIIDAGHWGTEWPTMQDVHAALTTVARERGLRAPLHLSTCRTDPWTDWSSSE